MKTKDIKFTLGSGGKYKSADASTITIEGFEVSSPRRDQEVEIADFDMETLASFVSYEELLELEQYDLDELVKAMLDKHGHGPILKSMLLYEPKQELIDEINDLEP